MLYEQEREKGLKPTCFTSENEKIAQNPVVLQAKTRKSLKTHVFYEGKREKGLKPMCFTTENKKINENL